MTEKFIDHKAVILKNNCPQCYSNDGLRLSFKQRVVETALYKSITPEIQHELACKTCNSIIYPVQWTDDIERVVAYQKRAFTPQKTSTHFKKTMWLVIAVTVLLSVIIVLSIFYTEL
ncbi:hypothetical protein GSB9_02452 [Flavobacteriaceae bacterium GSB9]|nr:hypothetical protein GSB9_02452 [Flavobacteriaceae bacterium GSB9]